MNYREKIRKAIECPQLGNETYGEFGILNLTQRKYIKRLLDELDNADNFVKKLYFENKQLKMIVNEYEKLNKGFKITNVQEYNIDELLSYKKYKDNWNKLKEIAKSQSGFKKRADLKGGLWFEIDDLLDKMQEIEGSDNQ